jgi:GNAT superfamily N-acetyltransferase
VTADPTARPARPDRSARSDRSARTRARSEVVVVRPLVAADVDASSALQASAPPSARLDVPAALGAGFLRRWQLAHLDSPHAVALVAERAADTGDDDAQDPPGTGTCGVLLAVLDAAAHREHLLRRHGPALARAAGAASVAAPQAVAGWVRHHGGPLVSAATLLPTRGGSAASARRLERSASATPAAVLESVVVHPSVRGTGTGRQLLSALAAQAAALGARRVEARVPWGTGAEGFFTACGWTASTTRPSARGGFETRVRLDL